MNAGICELFIIPGHGLHILGTQSGCDGEHKISIIMGRCQLLQPLDNVVAILSFQGRNIRILSYALRPMTIVARLDCKLVVP